MLSYEPFSFSLSFSFQFILFIYVCPWNFNSIFLFLFVCSNLLFPCILPSTNPAWFCRRRCKANLLQRKITRRLLEPEIKQKCFIIHFQITNLLHRKLFSVFRRLLLFIYFLLGKRDRLKSFRTFVTRSVLFLSF